MIRLKAKVLVMGSLGVIKSIRPSTLFLDPLISVYGVSLYIYVSRWSTISNEAAIETNYVKYAAASQR